MSNFTPSYIIQDTIQYYGPYGYNPLVKAADIEIYKISSYGNEAIPNNLKIMNSESATVGLIINALVSITERKFREIIENWNDEMILRDMYDKKIDRDEYCTRLMSLQCHVKSKEISNYVDEVYSWDHTEEECKLMIINVTKALSVNWTNINSIMFKLGYRARDNCPRYDTVEVEYVPEIIRSEIDYYLGSDPNTNGPNAASMTNNKINNYKKGLANVFKLYIDFIQMVVNENYSKELPDDIWNKYIIIRDDKFRSFIKSKINMIKFVDTWYYTSNLHSNIFESNQEYLEEVRNMNPDQGAILAEFSSNFGATVLIDIAVNSGQSCHHSYKSFIQKNWKMLRLECLRKGISVHKQFRNNWWRTFLMMNHDVLDGSRLNTHNAYMHISFRLKASLSDKILCHKYGIKFEPMQLDSSNSTPKVKEPKVPKEDEEVVAYAGKAPIVVVYGKITNYKNPKENVLYLNKDDENKEWALYIYGEGKWTRIYGVEGFVYKDYLKPSSELHIDPTKDNEPVSEDDSVLHVDPNKGDETVDWVSELKPMTPEMMSLLRDVEGERRSGKLGDASKELDELLEKESNPNSKGVSLNKEDYKL